jgi:hypothetical protein
MLYIVSCEIVPESNLIYSGRISTLRKYYWIYIRIKYNIKNKIHLNLLNNKNIVLNLN